MSISAPQEDPDSDNSDQSEDYYEYQRRKMQQALSTLKQKSSNNKILQQLQKNTATQMQYLEQYEDQVADLHKITRQNNNNVLDQSVIREIKEKVFSQSMLHTMQLADHLLEQRKKKEDEEAVKKSREGREGREGKEGKEGKGREGMAKGREIDQVEDKINRKMEMARQEREIVSMAREDQLSLKYQQQQLSDFFAARFFTPVFKVPENKKVSIKMENYKPRSTFTNLRPLPNTEANVLPRNAPELALRRLGKAKKISLVSTSSSEVAVKIKKLNPEEQRPKMKQPLHQNLIQQQDHIENQIQQYLKNLLPILPKLQSSSKTYHPKFLPEYPSPSNPNISDPQPSSSTSTSLQKKSLSQCLSSSIQNPSQLKQLTLTFENMTTLTGIQMYQNIQCAQLQFNKVVDLDGIEKCRRLVQVDLARNRLRGVDALAGLPWLRVLNIQANLVESLLFKGGALEVLYSANNRIQDIVDLSANVYLKRLVINNNRLHAFNGLNGLYYLQQIIAHNNFIQNLQGLQECISLQILDICHNRLQSLFPNFTYMFLSTLKATNNLLETLPNMLLPSLQYLYLSNNKIQQFPITTTTSPILYFPSLHLLNIDNNKISGFGTVWAFLRFSCKLEILFYDKNAYFQDLRDSVKEVFLFGVGLFFRGLRICNHGVVDSGISQYYQGVYAKYLTGKGMFKKQSNRLRQLQKKVTFTILQNQHMSRLQDKKHPFCSTQAYITKKSTSKPQNLLQILTFMQQSPISATTTSTTPKILHASNSLLYQHDKFEYKRREALHRIANMVIAKQYRISKRKRYLKGIGVKLRGILREVEGEFVKGMLRNVLGAFYLPIKKMGVEKAAIVIQKNWRAYKTRQRYLKVVGKLKRKDSEFELEEINMDQYDFDNLEVCEFNFEIPEELDFDPYIIRPEIFELLQKKQIIREQKIKKKQNSTHPPPQNPNSIESEFDMVAQNQSRAISSNNNHSRNQKIQRIMKSWGISREAAVAQIKKQEQKDQRRRKEEEENMSAAEKYKRLIKNKK